MEIKGFNENEISEQNKEALQSETWQKVRKALKTEIPHFTDAPEIQHFAVEKFSKNDNSYGVKWGNVVKEYLKTAYSEENTQPEVVSEGITYKILKRREVTVFYDADENTLFDVENKRLEKEYGYVMKEDKVNAESKTEIDDAADVEEKSVDLEREETDKDIGKIQEEKSEEKSGDDVPSNDIDASDPVAIKQMAKEKLEKEMREDKDKTFAEPVIGYLMKRCEEDLGLAQDVVQEHKTWKKCLDYIYEQARKQATGNRAAVRDDVVCEWAEDYYYKEEKKVKESAEHKKKVEERKKKAAEQKKADKKNLKQATKKNEKAEEKLADSPKLQKNPKEMDGQMDLFSMMGI